MGEAAASDGTGGRRPPRRRGGGGVGVVAAGRGAGRRAGQPGGERRLGALRRQVAGGDLEGGHPQPHQLPHHPGAGQCLEPAEPGGGAAPGAADPRRGPVSRSAGAPLPRGAVLRPRVGWVGGGWPAPHLRRGADKETDISHLFTLLLSGSCSAAALYGPLGRGPGPPAARGAACRAAQPRPRAGPRPVPAGARGDARDPPAGITRGDQVPLPLFFSPIGLPHWSRSPPKKLFSKGTYFSCLYNKAPSDSC